MTAARRVPLPPVVWILGVILPLVIGLTGVALQLVWLGEVPDPIAIHWGVEDRPDGFASPAGAILLAALLAIGLPAMFSIMLVTGGRGGLTNTHKMLVSTSLFMAVLISTITTATFGMQRGLEEGAEAGGITPWMLAGFAGGALLGIAGWFALPPAHAGRMDVVEAEPLDLAPGERGVWIASVRVSTGAVIAIASAVLFALAAGVIAVVATRGAGAVALVLPVMLIAGACTSLAWRVRVDASGLTVSSRPLGWPAVRIRPDEIARVETVEVEPVGEFGGFGWRWAPGRSFGAIARAGEAIEVERHDGRRFTVTVDGARTGAALLAAYVARPAPETDSPDRTTES
ncbi:DUF1648 domain-containing protein [Salinibacterium sp. ZJ70]|uniref:DUF1648 domain-containing protein n=1 Tax=Salinibacterium sp. ZJ70 TaxID=2708084 RepID=UPI001422387C|nr:DUF1648 domain-containing protein [Salinibacterium sp. ZJ70]